MASDQRLLITGGAGFIGSAFVRHRLLGHPHQPLRVLDALTYAGDRAHLEGLDVELIVGDVADPETATAACAGCGTVVHMAAESHVDRSLRSDDPFQRTNVLGTRVMLEAALAAGVERFVHVSTDEVYGDVSGRQGLSVESDPLSPGNPYAVSKARAETLAIDAGSRGLDVVITRGANTCGPRQFPEKVVPLFITNAMLGLGLPVYGDGTALRDWLHVDDHCAGIALAMDHGDAGGIYNLGARSQISTETLARTILSELEDSRSVIEHVPDRPGHDGRYAVDPSRAEALGWTRDHDFAGAIRQTIAWFADNEEWWRRARGSEHFRTHHAAWYVDRQA